LKDLGVIRKSGPQKHVIAAAKIHKCKRRSPPAVAQDCYSDFF